ncbi:hypothetical protein NQZ68_007466 [Dissostichus eleginoides]|nr:hypothetical protein NQZ68_007466 [Dissostichus eleginoides]
MQDSIWKNNPLSIHLAGFSTSAAPREFNLSSTFCALIPSSSHQSPSGLTAATSDLSRGCSSGVEWGVVVGGGFTPLKPFARLLLVKEAADRIAECPVMGVELRRPISMTVDTWPEPQVLLKPSCPESRGDRDSLRD